MSSSPTVVPTQLAAQYETLRAHAVSGSAAVATPLGLAVFLGRGMAAWLAICGELLSRPAPRPKSLVESVGPPTVVPTGVHPEAVRVLASMVLAACQKGGS